MSEADTAYNFDRYRKLLAEADDESKRMAFINLLIEEKARDRLAEHRLRDRLLATRNAVSAKLDLPTRPSR